MHPHHEVPVHDIDHRRVHVHLHVTEEARRALRLAAAHRGVSMADIITYWALAEARSLGLLADPVERRKA